MLRQAVDVDRRDGLTDTRPLHRPCTVYSAGSVNNAHMVIDNAQHRLWHCRHLSVRPSVRPPVCLSVRPIICPPHTAAAGLLLLARREGDIDRLLHGWAPSSSPAHSGELRFVANASSVTFTAAVER